MGTRSYIGIEDSDGTISGIYCHWDGYPEGVGAILRDFYGDPDRVRKLVAGGDLSILGPDIEPAEGVVHSFDRPADGVCVYYARDRGEAVRGAPRCIDAGAFATAAAQAGAEFVYVLRGKERWFFAPITTRGVGQWRRLTEDATTAAD